MVGQKGIIREKLRRREVRLQGGKKGEAGHRCSLIQEVGETRIREIQWCGEMIGRAKFTHGLFTVEERKVK